MEVIYKNQLYFYTLAINNPKINLNEQELSKVPGLKGSVYKNQLHF